MKEEHKKINRRRFLRTIGAVGVGSVFTSTHIISAADKPATAEAGTAEKTERLTLPMRKFGRADLKVPCLSFGGMFNLLDNQITLARAYQLGVTYWDTAYSYAQGNSEIGIGRFLTKYPERRKDLFIATKASGAKTLDDMEGHLQTSLKRMNTDHIDLYFIHDISRGFPLNSETQNWAQKAKEQKLIRYFGFTTHSNMADYLNTAAKLDWIDAIMTRYDFRLMQDKQLSSAIDACQKAGIALVAMKTQGRGQLNVEDRKLINHFLEKGFTEGQAKVKAVLQDERFASACVNGNTLEYVNLNVAAVLDKTKLTQADMNVLKEYAQATCSGYCAGCASICDAALPDTPYVSDIMRYLMYYNSYGERDYARELFAEIPADVRNRLPNVDYSLAEARCPQRIPIGHFVAEAVSKLA